jgi:multiple sugar transport system permease protein
MAAAVAFALLLYRRAPGIGGARAIAYIPTVVPDAAYALLWLWILNPLYGPLPMFLESIGIGSISWLTDPWGARFAVALMGVFQIGEAFVIALAARRAIPNSLYDAARVDGASDWFTLTRVTLPLMGPILALLALRDVILTLQVNFVPALLVTDGGPRYATTFLPLYVYRTAFRYFRLGYASTIALTMFAVTALIVFVQYRLARRWRLL